MCMTKLDMSNIPTQSSSPKALLDEAEDALLRLGVDPHEEEEEVNKIYHATVYNGEHPLVMDIVPNHNIMEESVEKEEEPKEKNEEEKRRRTPKRKGRYSIDRDYADDEEEEVKVKTPPMTKKKKVSHIDNKIELRKAKEMLERLKFPFDISTQELENQECLLSMLVNTHDTFYSVFPNFKFTTLTWKANPVQLAVRHVLEEKKKKEFKSTLKLVSDDDQVYCMVFDDDDNKKKEQPSISLKDIQKRLRETWECAYGIENNTGKPKKPYPSPDQQLTYLIEKKSKYISIKKFSEVDNPSAHFLIYRLKREGGYDYQWLANHTHYDKIQLVIVPRQHTKSSDDLESFTSFLDARDKLAGLLTHGEVLEKDNDEEEEEEPSSSSAPFCVGTTTTTTTTVKPSLSPKSTHFLEILETVVTAYSDQRMAEERARAQQERDLFEKEKEAFLKEKQQFEEKRRKLSDAISLL